MTHVFSPLPATFYHRPTLELAKSLLGCVLVKDTTEGTCAGIIAETEAYLGEADRAAHSFGRRYTKRTAIMFEEAGHVYTYTMHTHCLVNVVSAGTGKPEAVLIRALEPAAGMDIMMKRRPVSNVVQLTSGPGKLTQAMGITMDDYGRRFTQPPLYIAQGDARTAISSGKRIGIGGAGEARDYPWRFWLSGNAFVSR